jgi:hypothetical protein
MASSRIGLNSDSDVTYIKILSSLYFQEIIGWLLSMVPFYLEREFVKHQLTEDVTAHIAGSIYF